MEYESLAIAARAIGISLTVDIEGLEAPWVLGAAGAAADGAAAADAQAATAWSAVVAAAGAGGDLDASLDFQQFLVGLHRARPAPAVAKGWLEPPEGTGDDNRV